MSPERRVLSHKILWITRVEFLALPWHRSIDSQKKYNRDREAPRKTWMGAGGRDLLDSLCPVWICGGIGENIILEFISVKSLLRVVSTTWETGLVAMGWRCRNVVQSLEYDGGGIQF